MIDVIIPNADSQEAFGRRLAGLLPDRCLVFLHGDLGTGKTSLVRGILRGLGHQGAVRSPTYTLIEPYELGERTAFHLDLYRLADPRELDYLGLRDLFAEDSLVFVEWAERGAAAMPPADLEICLAHVPAGGRALSIDAGSAIGAQVVAALQ